MTVAQHSTAQHGTAWHDTAQHSWISKALSVCAYYQQVAQNFDMKIQYTAGNEVSPEL